ncbi:T9SS type A sorting domain-containing protein [Hymenobacter sp. YC55]|uniref:T9SS type A sorting domain-containing protein n=1 Tax=Hymenobacter sp. YC55 TaxID=3034019 RepID=UPI0023F9A34A|nr:T9SS type A sorting domain-containing protein [Hymenobacter sp. YC55]MDF7809744.1 T9SS type A sorting domain-containing protein [Hymenobacter sp. YC55]
MQFQIKLYEGTNTIEFVYGTWTATASTALGQPFLVGLKGNQLSSGTMITEADLRELSLLYKASAQAWSTTIFTNVIVQGTQAGLAGHFIRNTFLPDAGRTYRFRVAPADDAAVELIYSLSKTPTNNSQVIQAVISNTGTAAISNRVVTLNVTGANTFTNATIIPNLAPGDFTTVSFGAFTPMVVGNNTITVAVPADGLASNNTQTFTQAVTTNTYSAAYPGAPAIDGLGFRDNGNASTGILATKYTASIARTVTAVNIDLEGANATANTSVGRTVYAVVLSSTGAILGRTPDYVIQAGDIGTYKTFTLPAPVAVPVGDFYVGLAQPSSSNTAPFYPLGFQLEEPTRTGSFYVVDINGGTPEDVTEDGDLGRFMIEAVVTGSPQGTSAALNRAVEMYPNPATGLVRLAVQGANAKGQLNATVINQLGQVVHTARLKDNFTNELDLSSLSNGLYLLKVQTGNDFTTRQLVLTK